MSNNCTIIDGQKICYISTAKIGYWSSLLRDFKLIFASVVVTCIVTAAYNYYLYCQCQNSKKQSREKKKKDVDKNLNKDKVRRLLNSNSSISDNDDPFANEMQNKGTPTNLRSKLTSNLSSRLSTRSLASSLASLHGVQASGNFLTAIFSQMWNHINIAVSNTIKEALEPTLRDLKVPLHFIKLDLGDVPIRTENMFIHRVDLDGIVDIDGDGICDVMCHETEQNMAGIQIDVDVVWDGNCDIMLQATFSKSMKVTFGVKRIKLRGRMHILLSPLTSELPVISAVQYGFTNPPEIQLDFSGAVQSVTNKLGFVQNAFISVIQSSLASMLVLPNRMVMPMDLGSYDYLDTYRPPVGMVRVTAESGRGFTILKKMILNDIPDTYCVISLGGSNAFRPPFRTSTQYDNLTPSWDGESCDFILYDMDQKIYIDVYDEDATPMDPDDLLGKAEITVRELLREPNDGTCELQLIMDGDKTECYITLSADLFHLSDQLHSFPDGMESEKYEGKNELCGLATVIVTKAFDIPIPRRDAATYVKVTYGKGSDHKKTFYTGSVVDYPGIDALNPMYDCVFHIPLTAAMLQGDKKSEDAAVAAAAAAIPMSPDSVSSNGGARRKRGSVVELGASLTAKAAVGAHSIVGAAHAVIATKRISCKKNDIIFTLMDGDGANGTSGHGALGKMVVTHEELLRAYKHTITQTRPIGDKGAKLEFRIGLLGMQSEEERLEQAVSSSNRSGDPQAVDDSERMGVPTSVYSSVYEDGVSVRITAVRGRGFSIKKRRFGKKDDVPDLYCVIRLVKVNDANQQKEIDKPWKTRLIKDDTMPSWNESRDFSNIKNPARYLLLVDINDHNRGVKDDYLGTAKFSLEKLLRKRVIEGELREGTTLTKSYITLRCVEITEETTEVGDVLVHCHPELGDEGFESTMVGSKAGGNNDDEDDEENEDSDIVTPLLSMSAPPPSKSSRAVTFDDQSTNSTSSSMSKKLSKIKSVPRLITKKLPASKKRRSWDGNSDRTR